MRVLVVAAPSAGRGLVEGLRRAGLATDGRDDVPSAEEALRVTGYDAVVVQADLPVVDGLALAGVAGPGVAVIVMGADVVLLGLGSEGATAPPVIEDQVDLDVDVDELALRIRKAVLRRTGAPARVRLGRMRIDRLRGEVTIDGHAVRLSRQPMAVLDHIVAHRDRLVSSEEIFEHCWDERTDMLSDPVYTQVTRLRRALAGVVQIVRVPRVGYRLQVVDAVGQP